jgi:4-amino-4-deoxy-L-arabinose transferase-like glycosyltransferase
VVRGDSGVGCARRWFVGLWLAVSAIKVVLAVSLPVFVDEAFYWLEGRHLAWAYSDLPGLNAWLARLGTAAGGDHALALRLPFLLIGACIPWLIVHMTRREYDARTGWQAGSLALLLPLSGTMGLLALPDAPLLLATLLCLDASLRLLRRVDGFAAGELALGLALGGLCHYRFAAVIAVGMLAMLSLPAGRRALQRPLPWLAVGIGALAWLPLLLWNLHNADAGLQFQLVDRHPWTFSSEGIRLGRMQLVLATPLLLVAMTVAAWRALRAHGNGASRYLASCGAMIVLGFLALGFFADRERVSFHWPLPGYLALLPLVPAVLVGWSRGWRTATWATAALGLLAVLGYYVVASVPAWRAQTASQNFHPTNFAGWSVLAEAVDVRLASMPAGTRILAGDFKLGAELGFARSDAWIPVLDHPINDKHGRTPQLALWGLLRRGRAAMRERPALLVVAVDDIEFANLLRYYHRLCEQVGPLPAPEVLNIDHGRQRFLLFALVPTAESDRCTTPALAFLDAPIASSTVAASFEVGGWAFKDGVGLSSIQVLLDGRLMTQANYGAAKPDVAGFWKISTDPNQPRVGFHATVAGAPPGSHWLGLRLHGTDGSVEDWSEQRLEVR